MIAPLKTIANLPSVESDEDSSIWHVSRQRSPIFSRTSSVRDEAALLLSISSICDREVKSNGFSAIFDDEFPKFPLLSEAVLEPAENSTVKQPEESLLRKRQEPQKPCFQAIRARSVSIDSPGLKPREADRTISPVMATDVESMDSSPALVSPVTHQSVRPIPRQRKQSLRLSRIARRQPEVMADIADEPPAPTSSKKGRTIQASPPEGIPIKLIGRKKFSWKCYPELEDFLIANREEYLRHSALNYTVQQKQYNNRLTDQLLELATRHGYLFDTQEFSFVTVRDRIRCYYKSYVQSAKKRGVLMGYAARKAGLLTEDDLVGNGGRIVTTI